MGNSRFGIIAAAIITLLAILASAFQPIAAQPNAALATAAATKLITPTPINYSPAVRTIWQAEPQLDQQTGNCSGSPVNYCSQLVALTPRGKNMYWKGQELKPYLLIRIKPNVFYYSGRNALGDGTVKVTLQLTSETTFKATQVLKLKKEPTCTHTMQFSGTFLR